MPTRLATQSSPPIAELKAEMFKALAHPGRIRVLEVLANGPRSVGDLLPVISLEASHLSQQLGVLRRAGLVTARKEGVAVIYTLSDPQIADLLAIAKRILLRALSESQDLLADLTAPARR